jgi:hypothetical protein
MGSEDRFSLFATLSSIIVTLAIVLYAWLDPVGFQGHLAKDGRGSGIIEHLTVIILIPGILAGIRTFLLRGKFPHRLTGYWVLAWTAACIYFAGEEASWGQWYFNWETPEFVRSINDQGETNLHNTTSWLDQKPRTLVELFILAAVFAPPLLRVTDCGKRFKESDFFSFVTTWILAPRGLLSAGLLYVMVKASGFLSGGIFHSIGNGELREFIIAWFLTLYLISYNVRLPGSVAAGTRR